MTQNPSPITITVSHLKKTYGNVKAVEDVSFAVNEGEIFGLPILLLVILGLIPGTREPSSDLGGLSYFALLYPILVAVTILSQSINMLPRNLIKYRETGILRRLSVTPVPPSWLLAAQIVINLAVAVIGIILLTAEGTALSLQPLLVLIGYTVILGYISVRLFQWE